MSQNHDPLMGELRSLIAALETDCRNNNSAGLLLQIEKLKHWAQRLARFDSPQVLQDQNAELLLRLKNSTSSLESTVSSYRGILDSFETFRFSMDVVLRLKHLEDLPESIAMLRSVRNLESLHLVLAEELFAGRVAEDIQLASSGELREQINQFTPTTHIPRLFLGQTAKILDPAFFLGRDLDYGSAFIFALRHKYLPGRVIGTVAGHDQSPNRFTPDKPSDFLCHFSDILAHTLIMVLEHSQLEDLSVRDRLTGLNNRVYLERHAPRILNFATRKNIPVHMLFIDINGFKTINDQFGRAVGDQVLIAVGQAVSNAIRKYDIFVRLGSDEFGILLPDTNAEQTEIFVQRIRQTLNNLDTSTLCGRQTELRLSASVGIARFVPSQTLEDLLQLAVQQVYADRSLQSDSQIDSN